MNWIWICLIVIVGCAIVNPILYFIYWELYKRRDWVNINKAYKTDKRFWAEGEVWNKPIQIAPIRPQIKDVWYDMDAYWSWWFPVISTFTTLYYVGLIIARPFEAGWRWVVRKIANINV